MNINFSEVLCEDLKDDFEYLGKDQHDFTIKDLIQEDINKAFVFGCCLKGWKNQEMWIPVSIRKYVRHLYETVDKYKAQLDWISSKYSLSKTVTLNDYIKYSEYVLDNLFFDNEEDKLKMALILGLFLNNVKD